MTDKIRKYWDEEPLILIMALAILFRLVAIIFAKGWGMLDDHFLVIETVQSWVDGHDTSDWLPTSPHNTGPTGHNFFYPGLHYLLFLFFKLIHLTDPSVKMFLVRLIHGAFSLLTVWFGYRLTERLDGRRSARLAGLLLAVYWFMPWMSVRNLVEVVCIPFLVLGFWFMFRDKNGRKLFIDFLIAGLFIGLAMDIRYQSVWFPLGVGLTLLFTGKWREMIAVTAGTLISFGLIQGSIDYAIWGKPFVEFINYTIVNIHDKYQYFNLPWYNYFIVIGALLIPPVSLFMFYGFLREWKKYFLVFFPAALFFIFHSMFPNKQERFIIPFIPFFIILGTIGYYSFISGSKFAVRFPRFIRGSWIFFWVINLVLLVVASTTYSKKARVESMVYLSRYPDVHCVMEEELNRGPDILPSFYMKQWPRFYKQNDDTTAAEMIRHLATLPAAKQPAFILFFDQDSLQGRVIAARQSFPFLVYETRIDPGFIDNLLHWMNPYNKNKKIFIYRNCTIIPEKITVDK
jgi:hypothetical protein